ncbi:hypothetical protein C1H46_043485 [Malus baccata]|uniref:Gag1-like clamp domain-containing protein n=1 Tax=Malus baccata TaxID=106549 RepID=A0A540K9S6_MALBA|nr:hypothetical protein C1H46_043485 [Malus baccata]
MFLSLNWLLEFGCKHILIKSFSKVLLASTDTRSWSYSSGCLACHSKTALKTSVNEPPKGLLNEGRTVKKPSISEDFWTTSTWDMDNSAVQSKGSILSISTNQTLDLHGGSGSSNTPAEFVNHGKWVLYGLFMDIPKDSCFGSMIITCLLLWNQTRHLWVGNKKSESPSKKIREPKLSWNASYESLLGSTKPFPQPIPLPEMVDFLVDIWEQEGLYD